MPQKTPQEIAQRAQSIWDKLSVAPRSCIGMGIMPDDDIQVAVEQGFDIDDITTALLNLYETHKSRPVTPSKKMRPRRGSNKWHGK